VRRDVGIGSHVAGPAVTAPLDGVRVIEVATHVFVPMTGALLAEWGADVVKIEHPDTGDPYRGLVTVGLHTLHGGVDPFFQAANRSKRSVGMDLATPEGRSLLGRLLAGADVFTTNLRPGARRRLGVDVDDVRADNRSIVYALGTAFGRRGPDADRGGYDAGAYWARSGMQALFTAPDARWPAPTRPAFGDVAAALGLAAAVTTALYRRAATGEPTVVDSSLLASGLWQVQNDVVNARLGDDTHARRPDRRTTWNPLMLPYRTADGRFVALMTLAPDRHWPALCELIGRPDLADDPRFADLDARRRNAAVCVELLEAAFAERTLDEWRPILDRYAGEWTVVQEPAELHDDPQVRANGYVAEVDTGGRTPLPMVASPVQFDGSPGAPTRAPEAGEHTEQVLLDLGLSWDEIAALKERRVIT
jgi:crotonobetainyl-CoA:carnitine CoA-transferase CaiB-like acyl-CoA transferase